MVVYNAEELNFLVVDGRDSTMLVFGREKRRNMDEKKALFR
jgi:hypothetical protein